ncbi:uncharacterized protein BDR25DRAFT_329012 [Lindgomyces ingoldianus]|uniref:Uncharacterized protein n=1 Tax=Lindgomyces ingoldianus TaxID=673940 RepID=A0ACB6QCM0_9PLEO|nr:uncharacterized protein BDR25DRAFT_329012 [Lindgomyces ingoldianus]KAF2464688.1 hypothetical protein BDR25DRAFT_329012 [Lindgomyces ingoldianus]
MRPTQLLAAVVALSSLSAAWPEAFHNANALADVREALYGRQDNSGSSKPTATDDAKSTGDSRPSNSDASQTAESTAKETGKQSASGSDSQSSGKVTGSITSSAKSTATKSTKSSSIDPRSPAGAVSMVTPSALAGSQFYKIGDWVTFAWNYTNLLVTPAAVDVLATCTANQATYTLAVNMTVHETGRVLWDTGAYQSSATVPLLTETYTLLIYDAESSVSATAKPGYLGVFNQFQFGMYTPQPYTPWADYKCSTCNSALSSLERMTLKALLFTTGTTIASLLYFTYSFGMW